MLDLRFTDFRLLLCTAKLALIEAEENGRDAKLLLAHEPQLRLWGIALHGYLPKTSEPPLYSYEHTFTINTVDIKINERDPLAPYLTRLAGLAPNTMKDSTNALTELRSTPIITQDPKTIVHDQAVKGTFSYTSVRVGA